MRKILVPIDFSDSSEEAARSAVALAREFGARLTLLHVAPTPSVRSAVRPPEHTPLDLLQALARNLEAEGVPAPEVLLLEGKPGPTIVEVARDRGVDLIVIGSHGRTGLRRLVLGSVAEHVLRHASCPVLVARRSETREPAPPP